MKPISLPARDLAPLRPARLAALLSALAIAVPPLTAAAGEGAPAAAPTKAAKEEASTRFKKGIELFKDGDYQAALIEFRRAYELVPNWAVLYNIGQVQYQLQDYAGAMDSLERYLAEGGRKIPASRRKEVEKDLQKLKGRISHVELTINVPDAEIAVDDVSIGKGPFTKPIKVSAGRRKITASHEGYITQSKSIDVVSNDTVKLTFDLKEESKATAEGGEAKTPPPAGSQASSGSGADTKAPPADGGSSLPWAGYAVTGGCAAGAVVFGILALSASSDLQDLRTQQGVTPDELSDASGKTTAFAVVSDVFTAAALVAGGISLYLTVSGPAADETDARRTVPEIRVGVAPSGVRLTGRF